MIAVVIPCYRVKAQILDVLASVGSECDAVYVVDDACPEGTADLVEANVSDPRVRVLRREVNGGVGAATITGYQAALAEGAEVIIKLDGDGQMDPAHIADLAAPILAGEADYVKGNRFHDLEALKSMPTVRLIGNSLLSFVTKFSTGYWDLFDPTNGYTAIHGKVAARLPFEKISPRYFFESDLLFRLGTLRAVVAQLPMVARYGDERSNLSIPGVAGGFLVGHAVNTAKRIFYSYFLRNFSIASIELVLGLFLLGFGTTIGAWRWIAGAIEGMTATSGTVMLAALPVIIGVQLLLAFLGYDMQNLPREPIHRRLRGQGTDPATAT